MEKYNLPMRIMHWVLAVFVITIITVGFYMSDLPDSPEKWKLYGMHKSFGVLLLGLMTLRLVIRMRSEIPRMPAGIKRLDDMLAKVGVVGLYAFLFIMPLSGYIASDAGDYGVPFFGLMMPDLLAKNIELARAAMGVHKATAIALSLLVGLHIIGAFKHLIIDKINIFKRMW
jgi:cytochrome b561